jgi:predicted RNA-binding Zn ribbon-like protein
MTAPEFLAGNLGLDLCNSVAGRFEPGPRDRLASPEGFQAWAAARGLPAGDRPDEAGLARIRALRDALHRLGDARARGEPLPAEAVAVLDAAWTEAQAAKRVVLEGGRVAVTDETRQDWRRLYHRIVEDAVRLFGGDGLDRLKLCAGENCGWLFLDHSKNRSRRWCTMADCGTLTKVRRFRARQAGARE